VRGTICADVGEVDWCKCEGRKAEGKAGELASSFESGGVDVDHWGIS
jgi:hypothetical protein